MGRFFACAGLGVFFTLAASVLVIFPHLGQTSNAVVPRNFRMVTVNTAGLGAALGLGDAIYGTGARADSTPNTGLRPVYQWGLWAYGAAENTGGNLDYRVGNDWGFEFQPVPAILYDAPQEAQNTIATRLPGGTFSSSDYLGRFTKAAFYLLFIGALAGGLAMLIGFLAHRFAYLFAAILAFFGFLCEAAGCIIWTIIIHRTKSSIDGAALGITVAYGNGLWLYWAATGCLLFATLPFLIGCIAGRDRY